MPPIVTFLLNAQTTGGMTPLMKAAEASSEAVVYYLLELGVNPLIVDNRGKTALDYARATNP